MVAVLLLVLPGCSTYRATGGDSGAKRNVLNEEVELAIAAFKANAPATRELFENAHGYAIFPSVTKGAVGIGVARDHGGVYQQGEQIGYATLTQGTIGPQIGAQVYREVIFFENQAALDRFKQGGLAFSGRASAVGGTSGRTRSVDYDKGIAVFILTEGGLMAEASIGGQEFKFVPMHERPASAPGKTADERHAAGR